MSVDDETLKKRADDSVATALPIIVFPVPGGPNSSNPLQLFNKDDWAKISGRRRGRMIASYMSVDETTKTRSFAFTFSSDPTSSKPTVMLFGEINDPLWMSRFSLSFLHRIYESPDEDEATSCEVSGCASFCVL